MARVIICCQAQILQRKLPTVLALRGVLTTRLLWIAAKGIPLGVYKVAPTKRMIKYQFIGDLCKQQNAKLLVSENSGAFQGTAESRGR